MCHDGNEMAIWTEWYRIVDSYFFFEELIVAGGYQNGVGSGSQTTNRTVLNVCISERNFWSNFSK